MRGRPRKTPANDVQTRQAKWGARDAQSAAAKAAGHQGAETSDGAQPGADVARDAAEVAGTAQTGPEMAGDEPGDGVESVGEGEEAGHVSRETGGAGTAGEPGDAQTHQREGEAVVASEVPALDTDAALALRRLRERPLCCCGCGQVLSSPKKHFIEGHDGKAKVLVRKIMRGELHHPSVLQGLLHRQGGTRIVGKVGSQKTSSQLQPLSVIRPPRPDCSGDDFGRPCPLQKECRMRPQR